MHFKLLERLFTTYGEVRAFDMESNKWRI